MRKAKLSCMTSSIKVSGDGRRRKRDPRRGGIRCWQSDHLETETCVDTQTQQPPLLARSRPSEPTAGGSEEGCWKDSHCVSIDGTHQHVRETSRPSSQQVIDSRCEKQQQIFSRSARCTRLESKPKERTGAYLTAGTLYLERASLTPGQKGKSISGAISARLENRINPAGDRDCSAGRKAWRSTDVAHAGR